MSLRVIEHTSEFTDLPVVNHHNDSVVNHFLVSSLGAVCGSVGLTLPGYDWKVAGLSLALVEQSHFRGSWSEALGPQAS